VGTIDERRRTFFDAAAEEYDRVRPSYPEPLVREVLARTGARSVLEVGAGTGQATTLLARLGCAVHALEPGPRLEALLRRRVAAVPGVSVERTTFEAWSPVERSFDLVLSAQAFHWIDPAVRYAKAARAGRHLTILTNEESGIDPSLRERFDAAYSRWTGGDRNEEARRSVQAARERWTREIDGSGLYGPVHVASAPWQAEYDSSSYLALLATYSDHATLAAPVREGLFRDIADAIAAHGARFAVSYVALAFVATVRSPGSEGASDAATPTSSSSETT
jgi:SAM-dependent methyltransferase